MTEEIGVTGTETIDNMPMIGEFQLQTFSDNAYTTEITPDAPIPLGEKIYNIMTVTNLPTGFDYVVTDCDVANFANQHYHDDEVLFLFVQQTCKNNDMKDILGIDIHGKDAQSMEY